MLRQEDQKVDQIEWKKIEGGKTSAVAACLGLQAWDC
jgi:hypothetical protein